MNHTEKEVKGKAGPLSRTSSALALPSLGDAGSRLTGGISKAFAKQSSNLASLLPTTTETQAPGTPTGGIPRSNGSDGSDGSDGAAARMRALLTPGAGGPGTATPSAGPVAAARSYFAGTPLGSGSGSGTLTPGGGLFGTMSPHNPVWKHEVSL